MRGIREATFLQVATTFGGMDVSDARKHKALQDKNIVLNRQLVESAMDSAKLKGTLTKDL
jgi:putative transposase